MDFRLPELGEGIYEAELIRWLVKPGDGVRRGQGLMEVMTDKATMEVPSPFAGVIDSIAAQEGQQLKVGEVILIFHEPGQKSEPEKPEGRVKKAEADGNRQATDGKKETESVSRSRDQRAKTVVTQLPKTSPSVRLMARKLNIDLNQVHGSGPGGRILIEDVASRLQDRQTQPADSRPAAPRHDLGKPGTRLKVQGLRRKMAEHMVQAKKAIPHSTYVDEGDVTELVWLRQSLRDKFSRAGIKLTYLPFFVKAVTAALQEIPFVNSSLDEAEQEIVLHDHYHIGVAAATPAGLIVPVLHDANRKTLPEIAQELERLNADARAGKSRLEDLRGGTFTITSIGGFGGLISTPIVNYPQAAILGIGRIVKRPVYDANGSIKPADLVYLSLSFDHRILDGAVAAAFCNAVMRLLQNPAELLLPDKLA